MTTTLATPKIDVTQKVALAPPNITTKLVPVTSKSEVITSTPNLAPNGDAKKITKPKPPNSDVTKSPIPVTPKSDVTKRTVIPVTAASKSDVTKKTAVPVAAPTKKPTPKPNTTHCKPSLNESKSALTERLKKCSNFKLKVFSNDVLSKFSNSQKDNIVGAFGLSNFSSIFNNQFLCCPGKMLLNRPVSLANEGDVVMPKHFQTCKNMSFQRTGKTVALFSFPGSGNSWVRQLIETTTGIYTGTYHDCDESYIISGGMIGEGIFNDNVIVVKIHWGVGDALKWLQQHNVIYIVRNPFDAILAEYNRMVSSSKVHITAHVSYATNFGE